MPPLREEHSALRRRYDLLAEDYRARWSRDTSGAIATLAEMRTLWAEMTRLTALIQALPSDPLTSES